MEIEYHCRYIPSTAEIQVEFVSTKSFSSIGDFLEASWLV